jgi:hypothetical protein
MDDPQEVIIVDGSGQEHIFPPGFNPRHAAAIVKNGGSSDLPTKPASAEQFMTPKDIENRDMTGFDIAKGAAKGVGRSVLNVADMAGRTGMFPGLADSERTIRSAAGSHLDNTNDAQRLGGTLETVAELALPVLRGGKALAQGAVGAVKNAGGVTPAVFDFATHFVPGGRYLRGGRQLLGSVLDASKPAASAVDDVAANVPAHFSGTGTPSRALPKGGGFSAPPRTGPTEAEQAKTAAEALLERLTGTGAKAEIPSAGGFSMPSARAAAQAAPSASAVSGTGSAANIMPSGGFSMPAVLQKTAAVAPTGRLAGKATATAEQEVVDAIAEALNKPAMPRVTTPPAAELPPGYQPRTSAPKPSAAAPKPKPSSDQGPRNYFLKSDAAPSAAPKGKPVTLDDLKGTSLEPSPITFEPRTIGGSRLAKNAGTELKKAGVSPDEVIADIQSRTDLTADAKTKLLNALMKLAEVQ